MVVIVMWKVLFKVFWMKNFYKKINFALNPKNWSEFIRQWGEWNTWFSWRMVVSFGTIWMYSTQDAELLGTLGLSGKPWVLILFTYWPKFANIGSYNGKFLPGGCTIVSIDPITWNCTVNGWGFQYDIWNSNNPESQRNVHRSGTRNIVP